MLISDLRSRVRTVLVDFTWDQWAQMGVFASSRRLDRSAADPEALVVFSLEIARADARLFDEVLDWLAVNERLVSLQRLRNLCRDEVDRSLVDASLAWAAQWRPRTAAGSAVRANKPLAPNAVQLFRDVEARDGRVDPTFNAHGWLKPPTHRTGRSNPPNPLAPINFAFRLRQVLGVGARSEVVRHLLTEDTPRVNAHAITQSAAFAKRNVHEALTALHSAGVVDAITVANEQRYSVGRRRWAALFGLEENELPIWVAWPQLFHALRRLVRWLEAEAAADVSEYMLASDARALAEEITPELRYAGVTIKESTHTGADYWCDFVALVDAALQALTGASLPDRSGESGAERSGVVP